LKSRRHPYLALFDGADPDASTAGLDFKLTGVEHAQMVKGILA